MDRQKYVHNQDYRDGYDEGVEDGKCQILFQIRHASSEIENILSVFKDAKSEEQ